MQDKIHPDQVPKDWPFPTYMGRQIEVGKVKKEPKPALDAGKFEAALF